MVQPEDELGIVTMPAAAMQVPKISITAAYTSQHIREADEPMMN
jgi:hypothetical protein